MAKYIEREAAIAETRKPRLTDAELRRRLANIPAADVVARDCYDRLLVENDELRKERPVVRCKDCICYHPIGTSKYKGDCDKHYERVQCDDYCPWAEVEQDG